MTKKPAVKGEVAAVEGLTPAQARMARAALHWSLDEVAAAVGVSRRTILRLENDQRDILPMKIAAIRRGYEGLGLRFLDAGPDAGAVAPPPVRVPPPA